MPPANAPRPPQQQRSRAVMERILLAAQEVVADRGVAALTMEEVASRAGVAVGTIYRRFAGKAALIDAVQERWIDAVVSQQQGTREVRGSATEAFEDVVTQCVDEMTETFRRHAALLRELVHWTVSNPRVEGGVHPRLQAGFTALCDRILGHPACPPDLDERRVQLVVRVVQATLEWRVTTAVTLAPDNALDALAAQLPGLALAHLTAPATSGP